MTVVEALNQALGLQLRPVDLFNYSTTRSLSERIVSAYDAIVRTRFPGTERFVVGMSDHNDADDQPLAPENTVGDRTTSTNPKEPGLALTGPGAITASNAEVRESLSASERDESYVPIAIVGMSGCFPEAANVEEFWENLALGKNSVKEVSRWCLDEFYSAERGIPGRSYCKWGGFLSEIDQFDPLFFNISPHEAQLMEPQHRLFLMESWKALEDAGYGNRELNGARCGVFVGCSGGDYEHVLRQAGRDGEAYSFMGMAPAILASRISYWLNLKGPSLAIDTACSSSGVAIHLACESLRLRTSDMALAGGVALMSTPRFHVLASQTEMLSAQGKCQTFAEAADGFVPGEAAAVLVLKRLEDAMRDRDHLYGIIRGSAINQDGKTSGITAPSGPSQTALATEVYERCGIHPETVTYVECHGTGTKIGDPIEIGALTDAFLRFTDKTGFCAVGSVKTNIGHTLMASAAASVVKVLLSLKHGQLPPSLHASRTSPEINFAGSPFYVNRLLTPWERIPDRPRRAAVSSFGFSGTNAHLVIEEAGPETTSQESGGRSYRVGPPGPNSTKPFYLVAFSARTDWSLRRRLEDFAGWLDRAEVRETSLENISYTLNFGRSHFERRLALVVSSVTELRQAIGNLLSEMPANPVSGESGQICAADIVLYREVQRALLGGLKSLSLENREEYRDKLLALGRLYAKGCEMDWQTLHAGESCCRLSLPTYPFTLERYWVDVPPLNRPHEVSSASENEYFSLQPVWQLSPPSVPAIQALPDEVLVFDEDEEFARNLMARWPGVRLLRVVPGETYQRSGSLVWLRVNHQDDYERLLEEVSPQLIVYRWSVGSGSIEERLARGVEAVLCLSRSVIRTSPTSEIRFLFVHGSDAPPEMAAISAFLQTVAEENPKVRVRTVITDDANGLVVDEALRGDDAREVRFRDQQREVKTFVEMFPQNEGVGWFRARGVYLITGGTGGLGQIFSEHLARNYQARLIWLGRSELTAELLTRIEDLRAQGAEVLYVCADVTRCEELFETIRQAKARFGTLNGVIHAAGVLRNSFLFNKQIEDMRQVVAAKVRGTLNLDQALATEPLDVFLLCSSIASVLPEAGQSDYAFANRFLDEFASRREGLRARGLRSGRTMAINWQMWRDGGIIAGRSIEELRVRAEQTVKLTGLPALAAEQGIHLLEQSAHLPTGSGFCCYGNRKTLLHRIGRIYGAVSPQKHPPDAALDEQRLYAQTETYVKGLVSDLLQLPLERFAADTAFSEYGLDSILITRFNGRIAKDLPDVSKTLLFEYPNAAALSGHLVQAHRAGLAALFKEELELQTSGPRSSGAAGVQELQNRRDPAIRIGRGAESCDVAIIGVAGRYPEAPDLTAFWSNLQQGRNSVREIPPGRWADEDLYDSDPAKASQGKLYCKWGGFVEGVDEFDAPFFNISPAEAETMDPQDRLFLETAWHALEDAGYARSLLSRSLRKEEQEKVGVFVGVTHNSYQLLGVLRNSQEPTRVDHSGAWSLANRVSYYFNFRGPSLPVDTACSASLSAIHLACESLRSGECQVALAGGVNLHLNPSKFVNACALGMLSATGQCHSFGAGADGYVPGEGVGAVVLKSLNQAHRDGDFIYGVIKASAINHGGRTNGFSVPNPAAQAEVIMDALQKASLDPRSISYIEAHGTGTELGDPIEVDGLTKAFAQLLRGDNGEAISASSEPWCALGSVKSNIGHLEAAAGIAGLTKILLQMRYRQLTPSLHAESVNPNIDFARTPFLLQRALSQWAQPTVDGIRCPRRAGISSFGAGGANAHLIVEEYDHLPPETDEADSPAKPVVILLSARGESQLKQAAVNLLAYLQRGDAEEIGTLGDIAYTLQIAREPMEERLAMVVTGLDELRGYLAQFVETGAAGAGIYRGSTRKGKPASPGVFDFRQVAETATRIDLETVASHWVAGEEINWRQFYSRTPPRRIPLPAYPFLKKRYWYGSYSGARLQKPTEPAKAVPGAIAPASAAFISCQGHWMDSVNHFQPQREVTLELLPGDIALVRMQDRENRNMFTPGILQGLMASFAEIERNEAIKTVLVTGCDNIFSMGGTRAELMTLSDQVRSFADLEFIFKGFLQCRVPVIAAIQGHASGGGLVFGLYADIVFMAEEALYSAVFTKYGFTPGLGATFILREKLGDALATEMMMTAGTYRGADLMRRGANVAFKPQAQVFDEALITARALTEKPAYTLRILKQALARRKLEQLPAILAEEVRMHAETFGNPEVKRRIAQFIRDANSESPTTVPAPSIPSTPAIPTLSNGQIRLKRLAPTVAATLPGEAMPLENAGLRQLRLKPAGSATTDVTVGSSTDEDVRRYLIKSLCEALHLESDALGPQASFRDLGLDSVSGVEFIHGVNRTFGLHLDASIVYDHVHLDALHAFVTELVNKNRISAPGTPAPAESITPPQPRPGVSSLGIEPGKIQLHVTGERCASSAVSQTGTIQGTVSSASEQMAASIRLALPQPCAAVTNDPHLRVTPVQPSAQPWDNGTAMAIIGMSCRLPGAPDLASFWRNLAAGVDSVTEVPTERWDVSRFFDPDPNAEGKTYCKWAGFIDDVDKFDPLFFNLAHAEAEVMDPQQRIFLEESWKAFENAGYSAKSLSNVKCGVFVGAAVGEYGAILRRENPPLFQSAFAGIGLTSSILAARISYLLNLKGPSISLDTACSSSLVALHQACRSIQAGDCEMALVGGINLILDADQMVTTSKMQMLSPHGRCRSFDHQADGIALSEGVAVVILKPLASAIQDGDGIRGIIIGSGINQDGKTNGITAPSAVSQAELEKEVYHRAGVNPEEIDLVEAHGTGTLLGDPVEVRALTDAFRAFTDRKHFCALGSVKSNIGHTSFAAGLAGVIKVLLSFENAQIPPSIHFEKPNEHIDFESGPFFVNTRLRRWEQRMGRPRRAAVSSFGYSGTNAHVLLEEYATPASTPERSAVAHRQAVILSAKTDEALRKRAEDLREHLVSATGGMPGTEIPIRADLRLVDLAYTLQAGREAMAERLAIMVSDLTELHAKLAAFLRGESPIAGLYRGSVLRPDIGGGAHAAASAPPEDLARAWVQGAEIDWRSLYEKIPPRRVPLPVYPFSRERCWIQPSRNGNARLGTGVEHSHPLLHRNTSTISGLRFTTRLSAEAFYLHDHRVLEKRVLPGSAMLEMAIAGVREVTGRNAVQLEDVIWLRPLVVEQSREVHLLLKQEGEAIAFEIVTEDGASVVHARGLARTEVEFAGHSVDLAAVQQRCPQQLTAAALYEKFAQGGLHYGNSFQVISRIDYAGQEALASLQLKPESSNGESAFALSPNLLDGALQTAAVLMAKAGAVPFSLRRLTFSRLSSPCFAHVTLTTTRNDEPKYRIAVLDDQGQELVVIDDFTVRSVEPMPGNLTYLRPCWRNRPLSPETGPALHGTMLLFDHDAAFAGQIRAVLPALNVVRVEAGPEYQRSDTAVAIRPHDKADFKRLIQEVIPDCIVHRWSRPDLSIETSLDRGFGSIYLLTQALVQSGLTRDLPFLFISPSGNQPVYEALHAYIRTLVQEQPKLRMRVLTGCDAGTVLQELRCSDDEVDIRWSGGTRAVRRFEAFTPELLQPLPLRVEGVYLITGGTGALGQLFAEYLAKHFRARLLLLSRSALSEPTKARIRGWQRAGAEVLHVEGDVSQRDDVVKCVELGKERFGTLHGIIHAAGVIRDGLLWKKSLDDVWAVLRPKVHGALWLDEVTAGEPLDFLALFSSVAGLAGNVGQADYAYANAFLDAFARSREILSIQQLRHGRTVSINWPLWEEGGMKLPAELAALKMPSLAPLDTVTGFQIFETALRAREPQIAGLILTNARMPAYVESEGLTFDGRDGTSVRDSSGDDETRHRLEAYGTLLSGVGSDVSKATAQGDSMEPGLADAVGLLKQRFSQLTKIPADRIQPWEPLEKYGVDSILIVTFHGAA